MGSASPIEKAEEYSARAIRYAIWPHEGRVVRFRPKGKKNRSYYAPVFDLSSTGLAFVLERSEILKPQEKVLIELHLENAVSWACFAEVVRIDKIEEVDERWGVRKRQKVALKFHSLSKEHSQGLSKQLEALFHSRRGRAWEIATRPLTLRKLFFGCALAALATMLGLIHFFFAQW